MNNLPYIIEPYNAYYNKKRKKSLQEIIQEEEMMHRLRSIYFEQLNSINDNTNNSATSCAAVGGFDMPLTRVSDHIKTSMLNLVLSVPFFTPTTSSTKIYGVSTIITSSNSCSFIRNPNVWTKNIDLSCIPSGTQIGEGADINSAFLGCLIAPDIIFCAYHQHIRPNSLNIYFTDNNNNIYSSSYVEERQILATGFTDMCVIRIAPPLPSNIKTAKVLPPSVLSGSYITKKELESQTIPVIISNQQRELRINMLASFNYAGVGYAWAPSSSLYNSWMYGAYTGDSSLPSFVTINNELVMLMTFSTGGAGGGGNPLGYFNTINDAIADMGSTSKLTEVNLRNFKEF